MAQFTLYKNDDKNSRKPFPYFVNVQSDLLDDLNSRLVIPLSPLKALKNINIKRLCPVIEVDGKEFVLLTHQLTSVPCSILKTKVKSLDEMRHDILSAIDILLTGI